MSTHRYPLSRRAFVPGIVPPQTRRVRDDVCVYWFAFRGNQLLVQLDGETTRVPCCASLHDLNLDTVRTQFLGTLDDHLCYSVELPPETPPPPGMAFQGLRQLYGVLDEDLFWIAGRAVQIVDWDRTHQFCGACGTPVESSPIERVKLCPECGHTSYPRLAPAVIFVVTRGDRLLLAHAPHHPPGLYSVLAGFVEPGETLEECLQREVREEVGIEVQNIRYFGSQPWPFPHSLMIAFTCEHARGEIVLDENEIEDAAWFSRDNLPLVPSPISISRQLIDWFVSQSEDGAR